MNFIGIPTEVFVSTRVYVCVGVEGMKIHEHMAAFCTELVAYLSLAVLEEFKQL